MTIIAGKAHTFFSPNKLLFGIGTVNEVASEVEQLGGKKALIITDPGVVKAGMIDAVKTSLDSKKIPFSIYDRVEPEPPSRNIDDSTKQFKGEGCDLVIGVGGGSSLDTAKGVSIMATNKGNVLDFCGIDLVAKRGVPKILIPTTAGTGSEVTRVFVLTDERENTKKVAFSNYVLADVAIVDPMMTLSMPPKVTADTGIDALVHAIETYVSLNATPFSDILAEKAIQWIAEYLPISYAKAENIEARYMISLAATVAGMAFGSGGLGAVHALAYPLGTQYHMSHGRANAIMLPHVVGFNLSGSPQKYARIAQLMGKQIQGSSQMEGASLAVDAVQELLTELDISTRLRKYKIPKNDIPVLAKGGMDQSRLFVPNPRNLTKKDIKDIYTAAW